MSERAFRLAAVSPAAATLLVAVLVSASAVAQSAPGGRGASDASGLRVYAHTFQHRQTGEMLSLVRPLLSARGTVEEQPGSNTLVIRDRPDVIAEIVPLIQALDHPAEDVRLEIHVLRAGPYRPTPISPSTPPQTLDSSGLPPELVERLRRLLRYDDYQVLARAGMSSKEGEDVTFELDPRYSVSFRLGTVMAQQRLRLENFRFFRQPPASADKSRRLEPEQLFHATLNLWQERPFALVLSQNHQLGEALMVAISWHRESVTPTAEKPTAEASAGPGTKER